MFDGDDDDDVELDVDESKYKRIGSQIRNWSSTWYQWIISLIMVNIVDRELPVPSKTASVMISRINLVFVYIVLLTCCNLLVV